MVRNFYKQAQGVTWKWHGKEINIEELNLIRQKISFDMGSEQWSNIDNKLIPNCLSFLDAMKQFNLGENPADYTYLKFEFTIRIESWGQVTNSSKIKFLGTNNRFEYYVTMAPNTLKFKKGGFYIARAEWTVFKDENTARAQLTEYLRILSIRVLENYDDMNGHSINFVNTNIKIGNPNQLISTKRGFTENIIKNLKTKWFVGDPELPALYKTLITNGRSFQFHMKAYSLINEFVNKNCWNKALFIAFKIFLDDTHQHVFDKMKSLKVIDNENNNLVKNLEELKNFLPFGICLVKTWQELELMDCQEKEIIFVLFPNQFEQPHILCTPKILYNVFYRRFCENNDTSRILPKNEKVQTLKNFEFKPVIKNENDDPLELNMFIDIETLMDKTRQCYLVCSCDRTYGSQHFYSIKSFLEFLDIVALDIKKLNLFAHNGAKFDFIYFLPFIKNFNLFGDIHNIKQMIWNIGTMEVRTFDFFLTFSTSLNKLGEMFETSKKMSSDTMLTIKTIEDFKQHESELIEYCIQDCKTLMECHEKFISELNETQLKFKETWISAASLANNIFRSNFLRESIFGLKSIEYNIFNQNYFGGFTMPFARYMDKGYCYDLNSSYPSVMVGNIPTISGKIGYPNLIEMNIPTLVDADMIEEIAEGCNREKRPKLRYYHVVSYELPENCILSPFPKRTETGNMYYSKGTDIWCWGETLIFMFQSPLFYHGSKVYVDKYYEFTGSKI